MDDLLQHRTSSWPEPPPRPPRYRLRLINFQGTPMDLWAAENALDVVYRGRIFSRHDTLPGHANPDADGTWHYYERSLQVLDACEIIPTPARKQEKPA
jgi:hypothetical protein